MTAETDTTSTSDVIVVGGGIGGLGAALALSRKGLQVRLLESCEEFGEVGAGLQIAPNCTRILDDYGLLGEIRELVSGAERMSHLDAAVSQRLRRTGRRPDVADSELTGRAPVPVDG